MLDVQNLAAKYAAIQRDVIHTSGKNAVYRHIADTLQRCLPASIVTADMVEQCFCTVHALPRRNDPMYTGAIHDWVGQYLLSADAKEGTLLHRLHISALRLLPRERPVERDDIRLVTLDALSQSYSLPSGMYLVFLKHRLGLNGSPRLSCEEIAYRMHKPLTYIHELEAALLTVLSSSANGGNYAR